ncbi:hypothetical protein L1987_45668 [Smallanthus sonchifolius]|uniref:Uncharacterized protein n=1 Tax=Smallanthus sonchifolius TaxID=185202 RepID=A0ACB9FYM9_9ASTR|nr:hypothetical protein L1987_45668 [Smallanthus sonchifolius]
MEIPGNPELPTVVISEEVESALRPAPNTLESMVYRGSYSTNGPVTIQRPTKPLTERQCLINRLKKEVKELVEERDFYKQLYMSALDEQDRDRPYADFGRHTQDFVRFCFEGPGEGSIHEPRHTMRASRTSTSTPPAAAQTVIQKDSGLKAFQSCNPREFTGILGAIDAQEWLSRMKTIFQTCNCVPEECVRLATYTFKKESMYWWNTIIESRGLEQEQKENEKRKREEEDSGTGSGKHESTTA